MARNEQLIRQRELRGWSQRKVATEIGTSEKRVSFWECGTATPSPHFQEKLCSLFEKDAESLGFIVRPHTLSILVPDHFVAESLDHAESILNLAWEAWFAARPGPAMQETLKLLPRLDKIRHGNGAALHVLRAHHLSIRCHGLLGSIYLDAMQNDTALHHYIQAQAISDEIHDTDQSTTYIALIGDVIRRKGDKCAAIARMELARDHAMQASRTTRGHILQLLAYTYADAGNASDFECAIDEATDLLSHAGGGLDAAQHEFIPFEIYEIRGKANRDLGKPLEAIPYLELAEKSLAGESATPRWHALLAISRSQAFCDAGDLAVGIDLATRGFQMAAQCQSPRQMNRVRKLLRKLESSERRNDKRVRDLADLLFDYHLQG